MQWKIKHIFNYTDEKAWGNGFCNGGFHDKSGRVYFQEYFKHWIGVYGPEDKFLWTAGSVDPGVRNNPQEKDPLKLNLPKICSLDYLDNCLFIPEMEGDMVILEKVK